MKRYFGTSVLLALLAANLLMWMPKTWAFRGGSVFDQLNLLVDVRHQIVSQYVEEPDQQEMARAAVRGMIDSLKDPYTVYLAPEDIPNFDKEVRGTFTGIGAEVEPHQDRLRIVTPLEESPAWKAGVLAGDLILEINGESTAGMKITDAVEKLMGPEGSTVKVKVRHESGEEAELEITRARIQLQTVKGIRRDDTGHWDFMLDPAQKIGYIRINQFTERTAGDVRAALDALLQREVRGLILDVRFNPGGLLESAVAVADMFLEKDRKIVSVRGRAVQDVTHYSTEGGTIPADIPLVVLANEASASAAEVVAGALTDNDRAIVVGWRTYGKGSVQQVMGLENNQGALKITNAYYYLPSDRLIHRREGAETWGVDPAEGSYVAMSPDEIKQMIERRRAGDVLRVGGEHREIGSVTPEVIQQELADPQLAAGLRAVLGKLQTGEWPQVGKSGAQLLVLQTRKDNLERQRELLLESVAQIEQELRKLNGGEAPADVTITPDAGDPADDEAEPAPEMTPELTPEEGVLPAPRTPAGEEFMEQMPPELPPKPAEDATVPLPGPSGDDAGGEPGATDAADGGESSGG